jgi:hypothetical protein
MYGMKLAQITDPELLSQTKRLVQEERDVLTEVLQHLHEIDRRKLFSDLGYRSLFDYAVEELKYSEGQAGRRLQAMRLIREIPEVEKKITTGALSLSNISQAQNFFRNKSEKTLVSRGEKLEVLKALENKSAREGQKELLKIEPLATFPKERERVLTEDHSEVRFVLDREVKKKLEEVRALIGPKGATMSFPELLDFMANMSVQTLKAKRFGKKISQTPTQITPAPEPRSHNPRYVSKKTAHLVWQRDGLKCTKCGGTRNLNIDHIQPVARGGQSNIDNLRVLCFSCNQREAIKEFGVERVGRTARTYS